MVMPLHADSLPPFGEPLPELEVGDTLGPYRLEALAGEGGMGRVFRATHTDEGRPVALKVLRRRYARRPEAIARFFQEAQAVNRVHHPNIIEITDFVEGPPGGDSYYIMRWLEGETVAARLARTRVLPASLVLHLGRQVASALAAVHARGVIHRDLKPDNLFLIERSGRTDATLIDFGVAQADGERDGVVAGTPAYLSPEAAAGRPLDGRSDIYAVGVVLYELLAGAPPFRGATLSEYVMKHMTEKPRPLTEVVAQPLPPGLSAVVARCLAKDPADRYQSMDELEAVLASLASGRDPARAQRRWMALGAGALALAAAAALAYLLR